MDQRREKFLNLKIAPARLNVDEAAWYLGFSPHEIPILMAKGLLKPLGRPPASGTKYFATSELDAVRNDTKWLAKASDCIVEYWRSRNEKKHTAHAEKKSDAP
jgi:hypothetical protein